MIDQEKYEKGTSTTHLHIHVRIKLMLEAKHVHKLKEDSIQLIKLIV